MGANARSTVGTATDANAMLRILFSRHRPAARRVSAGVLLQRRRPSQARARVTFEKGGEKVKERAAFELHRRHVPRMRGPAAR